MEHLLRVGLIECIVGSAHPDSVRIELYSLRQIYSAALLDREWRRSGVHCRDILAKWESTTVENWMCWVFSNRLLDLSLSASCRNSTESDFGFEDYYRLDDRYLLEVLLQDLWDRGDSVCLRNCLCLIP